MKTALVTLKYKLNLAHTYNLSNKPPFHCQTHVGKSIKYDDAADQSVVAA